MVVVHWRFNLSIATAGQLLFPSELFTYLHIPSSCLGDVNLHIAQSSQVFNRFMMHTWLYMRYGQRSDFERQL